MSRDIIDVILQASSSSDYLISLFWLKSATSGGFIAITLISYGRHSWDTTSVGYVDGGHIDGYMMGRLVNPSLAQSLQRSPR